MESAANPDSETVGSGGDRPPARVMIVDDSLIARTFLGRTIEGQDDLQVVATANTAEQALQILGQRPVDIVLLDLEMPGMGGLAALPALLETACDAQVMVVSALTQEGANQTLAALEMGAVDTLLKPPTGGFDQAYRQTLLEKVRTLKPNAAIAKTPAAPNPRTPLRAPSCKRAKVLAIGGSTGGIHALSQLLRKLPRTMNVPILITQHLPDSFMPVLTRQLEIAVSRPVMVAARGMALERNTILIAPASGHLVVQRRGDRYITDISDEPAISGCTPSADPMFSSLANSFEGYVIGVVLSGMGRDGVRGAEDIVRSGGTMFAQDKASSAVWGMPGAVVSTGLAAGVLPPEKIADEVSAKLDLATWR